MRTLCIVSIATVTLASIATPAKSAWLDWSGGNLPVSQLTGEQLEPAAVGDGAGGMIVVWRDSRNGAFDIFAQHVLATGGVDPTWPADGAPVCTASNEQYAPQVVSDNVGGAIIAWMDYRGNGYDIYAQRIGADGAPRWFRDGTPICTNVEFQGGTSLAADGAGGALIAWHDQRALTRYDVYAQRVDSTGAAVWSPSGVLVCSGAWQHLSPTIGMGIGGGAVVAWQDFRAGGYDIYAQQLDGAGALEWGSTGRAVCTSTADQTSPIVVPDGSGGMIVGWTDGRSGVSFDIYAQRLNGAGSPLWAANGVPVVTASGDQSGVQLAGDGEGGAVFAWQDPRSGYADIYVQHLSSLGDAVFQLNGYPVCNAPGSQLSPRLLCSPSGKFLVAWADARSVSDYDVYAQRFDGAGQVSWAHNGVVISSVAESNQMAPVLVPAGTDGAVVAWTDYRNGTSDIFAQGVDSLGRLGLSVSARIAGVRDLPNDQGGRVKLMWDASPLDGLPYRAVADYRVWRSVPPNAAHGLGALGGDASPQLSSSLMRTTRNQAGTVYWEYVSTHTARGFGGYSTVVATTSDSLAGSNPMTLFIIEARCTDGVTFWDSPIDSGYSVDNLSPPPPSPFIAKYDGSDVALHWLPSRVADFAEFRLHRGGSISFVPGPSNLIFAGRDTGLVDRAGLGGFYKLAAVDVHGNVGRFAMVSPTSPTAALASFVSSDWTGGAASLVWYGAGLTGLRINVYRSDDGTSWNLLTQVTPDEEGFVRYTDASVLPRHRYSYKLGILDEDTEQFAGSTTIEIPGGRLAIRSVAGNPVRGETISFVASLSGAGPARARVLDLAGRVVREQGLQADLSGQLSLSLAGGERLRPGVYLLEVQQAGERAVTRFVYLK